MPVFKATRMSLFVRCAIGSSLLFGFSPVVNALSIVAPGQTQTLRPGDIIDSWEVQTGATLNVDGAKTQSISATAATLTLTAGSSTQSVNLATGSTATITGANMTSEASALSGFNVSGSQAQIFDSDIDATANVNSTGMTLSQVGTNQGGVVSMTGGSVRGGDGGISASALSQLSLENVQVEGVGANGYGLRAFSSDISVTGGSLRGGLNGVQYLADFTAPREGTLSLSGTRVMGGSGAAIAINGFGQPMVANLSLLNGTTLESGNGTALEIDGAATANVLVRNSQLDGTFAMTNASIGNIMFDNASLNGDISADATSSAHLTMANRSSLTGNLVNVDSVTLDGSSITGGYTNDTRTGSLSLKNGSQFTGTLTNVDTATLNGSAFKGDYAITDTRAGELALSNGSQFTGNVTNANSVRLDGSSLKGDYSTSDGRGASLVLQNGSQFTGNLLNVGGVTLSGQSIWNMVASNSVGTLSINDSTLKFGAPNEFFQLNVGTLAGSGTFQMDVDFATNQHDVLNVTGVAAGTHSLQIAGSGVDPVSPERLTVVHTGSGDATFALADAGVVDVGTFSYALGSSANGASGTDWFLDPSTKTISPGTQSVLALFNTAPTVWYGELTSLRTRMGELRLNGGQAGAWARAYGNKYDVNESSGLGYQQTQQGFSLGADAPLPIGDGQWLIGVLAGHSTSDLDVSRGTSGTVKSYYVGAYTTWLDKDTGYYFDGVLKLNRFRNDAKVSMSDGTRAKGDYDNVGMGGSVEFGRHIKLDDGYFVEPFTQWSTVVIQGKDYGLDNGMEAQGDRTRSLLGKVGMTAGRNFALSDGSVVQPYVRVAGVHEFAKNNEVQVNSNTFNNDLSGSRGELGAGVAVAFNDRLQLHADFDYSNGDKIEQPFGANVGLRYSW